MISLLLVLFFAFTGLTLNHPEWTFGQPPTTTEESGTLPEGAIDGDTVDFLTISEYVRSTNGVTGSITSHGTSGTTGWITYLAPGYSASLDFDTSTSAYTVSETTQGFMGALNDIHKGKGTNDAWSVVIDISALVLCFIALTGLTLEILNRSKAKRRNLLLALGGSIVGVVLMVLTLG